MCERESWVISWFGCWTGKLGLVATFSFKSLGHSCVRSAIGRGGEGINGVRW